MNSRQSFLSTKGLRPYLLISLAGILAFAPVSLMLKALKNDIINLEYPINYFISQCIRNGEMPLWFNTWGMGFPLHSTLTWGIYSTPQLFFSTLFDYNVYTLHIEFIFFVLLAGWSMFYLLRKYFLKDEKIATLLAICYMLSGFIVGSTQWLLYITAASFIPVLISSLLSLLHFPSVKTAIQLAVVYTLMLTSVYAAFTIITTYSLILFLLIFFLTNKKNRKENFILTRFLLLAGLFTIVLCLPCIYYTLELLKYINRGNPIEADAVFFNSNYLHPAALSSMLLPFSSVRMNFPNTEGTMLHTYTGLFVLLLLPASIRQAIKDKNKPAFFILGTALLFLFLSFGDITPLRNLLNVLPGFSYFRNPAIFRLFFIVCIVLFLANQLQNKSFQNCFEFKKTSFSKTVFFTFLVLLLLYLFVLLINPGQLKGLPINDTFLLIKSMTLSQTLLISSFIQLVILVVFFILLKTRLYKTGLFLLVADLIINTLICTPYFSVSSYSLREAQHIFRSKKGFPVQHEKVNEVAAVYRDAKGNPWNNVNVFSKKVSSDESYRGPLTLEQFSAFSGSSPETFNKAVVYAEKDSIASRLKIILQLPAHVRVAVDFVQPDSITLLQNNYPGWSAYYNNKKIEFIDTDKPGMTIIIPPGKGVVDFRYKKAGVLLSAIFVHLVIISFLCWKLYCFLKKKSNALSFHRHSNSLIH